MGKRYYVSQWLHEQVYQQVLAWRRKLLADDFENPGKLNHIEEAFNDVIGSLDISTNGDALSDVRDTLNKKLKCHGKAWLFSK